MEYIDRLLHRALAQPRNAANLPFDPIDQTAPLIVEDCRRDAPLAPTPEPPRGPEPSDRMEPREKRLAPAQPPPTAQPAQRGARPASRRDVAPSIPTGTAPQPAASDRTVEPARVTGTTDSRAPPART